MSEASLEHLFQVMETALESDHGIYVRTNEVDALRRKFYIARKTAREAGNERFEKLSFVNSPSDKALLWILKGANA